MYAPASQSLDGKFILNHHLRCINNTAEKDIRLLSELTIQNSVRILQRENEEEGRKMEDTRLQALRDSLS